MGAFDSKKSTPTFFAPRLSRTAHGVGFRTRFADLNRYCENTPDKSFGSNGADWVRSIRKKSSATFFTPHVARTTLGVRFRTSFGDRNRYCENTPDTSFGSNEVDWVRSIRKNQLQLFSLLVYPEWPSGSGFARVLVAEIETTKTQQT